MNTRIRQFMEYKGITPSELADAIGVQRSNITHVLHGRNKPGFQFITKILETFPEINAKWLITGEGKMLESMMQQQSLLFNDSVVPEEKTSEKKKIPEAPEEVTNIAQSVPDQINQTAPGDTRKVERIVVFFTDQTFKQYMPAK